LQWWPVFVNFQSASSPVIGLVRAMGLRKQQAGIFKRLLY
jgi:hypothetical protein